MIALFCETPYQLMNGLNLVYSEFDEDCVLFIMRDMFQSDNKFEIDFQSDKHSKIIKMINVKRYVDINYPKTLSQRIKFKIKKTFFDNKQEILLKYIPDYDFDLSFHKIITYKYSGAAYVLAEYLSYSVPIYCIEEGISEYIMPHNKAECKFVRRFECRYLAEPQLYPVQKEILKKIPKLGSNQMLMDEYERLFHFRQDIGKYKSVIYFDQPLASDYKLPGITKIEKKCFEIMEKCSGSFTIKCHPRGIGTGVPGGSLLQTMAPWECIAGELPDIENRILISIVSTCLASPKLLYGTEPYLIIPIKLFEREFQNIYPEFHYYERAVNFFENVRELYHDKTKVILPSNFEELEEALKMMVQRIGI